MRRMGEDPRVGVHLRQKAALLAALLDAWIALGLSGPTIASRVRFAVHGNWCGPGHGHGACVDPLDCLCRAHDRAYQLADAIERASSSRHAA